MRPPPRLRAALTGLALVLVAAVLVAALLREEDPAPRAAPTSAAPAPRAPSAVQRPVAAAIEELQRAYAAGDVGRLCRAGAVFTDAVVEVRGGPPGQSCESDVEELLAGPGRADLTVRGVDLRPDLAVAQVRTASGATVPVDLLPQGRRWLVSFSRGQDPLPALLR